MANLQIEKSNIANGTLLTCSGRLDANSAGQLNDFIDRLVREGEYHIAVNFDKIVYLSSAGIRALVNQHKNLKSINGYFYIVSMSDNVMQVLQMVGMAVMLSQAPEQIEAQPLAPDGDHGLHYDHGFNFLLTTLNNKEKSKVELHGKPELLQDAAFTASDARIVKAHEMHFAIGLGAIGDDYEAEKNRFGEFLLMGKNIAYLPADGSRKPDYIYSSGQLIASITELYGLHVDARFTHLLRFESETTKSTIGLNNLIESISELTQFENFAIVMLAESGGLIGTSLNVSPIEGRKLFTYPEIKNSVNFTTEPVHHKMLTISVGFFSQKGDQLSNKFTRPLSNKEQAINGHIHTAVFPYIPMKKTDIDLNETIDYLFHNSELGDILHLTNDEREISGLGESQFAHGFCWITPVDFTN